ncbi:MAG: hypothetical protein M9928_00240 [Anaerolineae bacterium]|nr:hypothetical protein [Anaerolineae bacterium]MCO5192439.1 hypothetical protein [Anaerolineae bacterium]MCO5203439.1 hypothetical protein [Anaerolineae bacterium]
MPSFLKASLIIFAMLALVGCGSAEPEIVITEVPITVEIETEVTRLVETEVTRIVEVEVTQLIETEVTRIVEVTPVPTDTPEITSFTSQDVLDAFASAGLEVVEAAPESADEGPRPDVFIEGQRFIVPSVGDNHGVRIFSFASPQDLEVMKGYYESFGGALASWVYAHENLLMQTSIDMPEELALQYRDVLLSLE